jgi:hypothetical protein
MINLPLSNWWLPLLGFIPIAVAFFNVAKQKKITRQSLFEFIVGALVLFVSINDNMNNAAERRRNSNSLKSLHDTLTNSRDTLLKIGIGIDEKTGKLLILDSQLLKKEFAKETSDSDNVVAILKNDSLYLYPKKGTWVHAYYAHDTANSAVFMSNFTEGMGTPYPVDKIHAGGKTYLTHLWKLYDRAVYKGSPIRLNMKNYENRYIIFGDEGIPSKRWIFQFGRVKWIPDSKI